MSLRLDTSGKAYEQVAAAVRRRISGGEFAVGDRLPTNRDLADEYGVAPNTVLSALSILKDEGIVTSQQGRGTFVNAVPIDAPTGVSDAIEQLRAEVAELRARLDVLDGGGLTAPDSAREWRPGDPIERPAGLPPPFPPGAPYRPAEPPPGWVDAAMVANEDIERERATKASKAAERDSEEV